MAGSDSRDKKKSRVLFFLEMVLLIVFLAVLFLYGQITSRLEELSAPASSVDYKEYKEYNEAEIKTNHTAPKITGYRTVAFFGLDHRTHNEELDGENSDTIIICSINNDTQDIKMVSIYRDTLLDIGDDIYAKANAAYAYGGPVQAVSMLNTNLDLKITDYVTVDFNAVVNLVDAVGGLDIPLSYAEIVHMNNYSVETSEETGKSYVPIELPYEEPEDLEAVLGVYHLNGVQATSYCRIRYTASLDMGRTERQRRVIQMVTQKLKTSGITRIFRIMDEVFPMIQTSLTKTEILALVPHMIGYRVDDTTGFPFVYKFSNIKGSIIVADTLRQNVLTLHEFLYGKSEDYTPSENIWEISSNIIEIVGGEAELKEEMPEYQNDDDTGDFIWTYNASQGGADPYALGTSQSGYSGSTSSGGYQTDSQTGSYQGNTWSGLADTDSGSSYNNSSGYSSQPVDAGEETYTPETSGQSFDDSGNDYDYDEPSYESYEESGDGGYDEEDISFTSFSGYDEEE